MGLEGTFSILTGPVILSPSLADYGCRTQSSGVQPQSPSPFVLCGRDFPKPQDAASPSDLESKVSLYPVLCSDVNTFAGLSNAPHLELLTL